jgi:Ca2+/H+ antiporter, TMEM165/GDT1 family
VTDFLTAVAVAFGVMFLAELGDKTQLLAVNFGARHALRTVAVGLALGYAVANVVAAVVGGVLGATLPDRPIEIAGGLIFLVFAVLAVRRGRDDHPDPTVAATGPGPPSRRATLSLVATVATTIAVAEMGDKTQIATVTLASQTSPVGVWIGATVGAATSGMVGAVVGNQIGDRISARVLHWTSAALFAVFGIAMLAGWF